MNDSNDKTETKRAGGGTLTLKRPTTEQSKVKQSFSHGRTKTVVVETKRKRFGDDKPVAPEAKALFQSMVEEFADGPSRVLIARCVRLAASPPADWTGIWKMESK